MLTEYKAQNQTDENGNPTGGSVRGTGLSIDWQNGPLGRGEDRKEPNGAFVETVIDAKTKRHGWIMRKVCKQHITKYISGSI